MKLSAYCHSVLEYWDKDGKKVQVTLKIAGDGPYFTDEIKFPIPVEDKEYWIIGASYVVEIHER